MNCYGTNSVAMQQKHEQDIKAMREEMTTIQSDHVNDTTESNTSPS